jgi:DNA repair exonuclease SbcCD nuclease subunit
MGDFKFIHCADIHLGSRFKGVETEDAAEMLRMREAPAKSLRKIIDLALSEKASFIVISGDLFEKTAQPSDRKFFCEEAARAKIPIFISKGNHDVERPWDSAMPYPSNVRVFPAEPESIFLKANSTEVEVVGISFSGKRENRNIVSMLSGTPGKFTVACVHCYVEEIGEGHPTAVCSMQDFLGKNVDYWALGHVHRRVVIREHPHAVYPGNAQGRNGKETGPKGAYVVEVSDGKVSKMTFAETQRIQWRNLRADVTDLSFERLRSELSKVFSPGDILSISFRGSGALANRICSDPGAFSAELQKSLGTRIWEVSCDKCSRTIEDDLQKDVSDAEKALISGGRQTLEEALDSAGFLRAHRNSVASMSEKELIRAANEAASYLLREIGGHK